MAMTLRTDSELEAALAALVEREKRSRQEIIRLAVLERYERMEHSARVAESAEQMSKRWENVLDRLAAT